jgi:amino acid adenylation domain-containing protein
MKSTGDEERLEADGFREFTRAEIEQPILARFEEHAALHSSEPAIRTGRFEWTYDDLAQWVHRVASAILAQCGAERSQVALMFDQDAPMIAAVLGALKAGKTYVPLDPDYPRKRLEFMISDSEAGAIVANQETGDLARQLGGRGVEVIDIDAVMPDERWEFPEVSPHENAYILYTSGSTGTPKGVVQNHRNVLHFIRNYTNNLKLTHRDRMTLLSSYAFDAAVMAIYGAVLNGACLFPRSIAREGFSSIGPWIQENEITIYHSTPTVYRYFLASCDPDVRFPSVRHVVLGGESVVRRDVELCRQFFSERCVMINGLGPTESTVTLQNFIDPAVDLVTNSVSVGYPVEDTEVYLVDDDGTVSDAEGEIVFQSEHLAVEYWNRAELTEMAFTAHPENRKLRSYRTGDLGRWLADGSLEFLGRKDFQVKVHGVRVELGEIESALRDIAGVEQALVVANPDSAGNNELAAYVIMQENACFDAGELRSQIQETLPPSMCPSVFATLESFPLTPTGKIDRRSLPQPGTAPARSSLARMDPENEIQRLLASAWKCILEQEEIGIDDDFFDSGGDSLKAVRLCDEIEKRLNRSISVVKLFEHRTVRALAAALEANDDGEVAGATLVRLSRHTERGGSHLFCICGIYLYEPLATVIGSPHVVSGVFLPVEQEFLRTGAELPSVEEMAAMYGEVIREAQPTGPYCLAGLSFGGVLAYELARQLKRSGEEVDLLALFDAMLPNVVSKTARVGAHATLLMRRGPSYLFEKLRGRMSRLRARRGFESAVKRPEFVDPTLGEKDAVIAMLRGGMYDRAVEAYRADMPMFDGDVIFFRALERDEFMRLVSGKDCGWSRFVTGRVEALDVEGGHITMLQEPNVQAIGRLLRSELDAACEGRRRHRGRGSRGS